MRHWLQFLQFLHVMPIWVWALLSVAFYATSAFRLIEGAYTPMTFAGDAIWATCMWFIYRRR